MQVPAGYLKFFAGAGAAVGFAALFWFLASPTPKLGEVAEPELSAQASQGKTLFEANCAPCHGIKGSGTDKGPPFIHDIYNPGHHSDAAFFAAAKSGVRQHHWQYGNMPPQPQVREEQVAAIVKYVRELQIANGISYRPHHM
jgi:mono/diheme cytochrome c family protein